jgi:3-oxoacyl-[acyl-carrier-protein] synthase-3
MLYIHGAATFYPENIIDNNFLESLDIGTSAEWILERVGIETRRTVLPLDYIKATKNSNPQAAREAALYTNAQTGALAAKQALQRAGISKEDIGMVISGTCTPESHCPAEACMIASELEIEVPSFDLNSSCSSVAAQLKMLSDMKAEELPDYILVVNPSNSTPYVNYADRTSAVLWGDATTALVVSAKVPAQLVVQKSLLESSPKGWDKVKFPISGHFIQNGRSVQTFAIKKSVKVIKDLKEFISSEYLNQVKFIGHQANLLMLNSVCRAAEIADVNHLYNVHRFGNCGAAGAPSNISENWNTFKDGDHIILAVVGAGLTWGGLLIEAQGDGHEI